MRRRAAYPLGILASLLLTSCKGSSMPPTPEEPFRKASEEALETPSHEAVAALLQQARASRREADAARCIEKLLAHKDAEVRAMAARSLAMLGEKTSAPSLIAALKDETEEVRGWAAGALGMLQAREAGPDLVSLLKDPAPSVRGRAAWALAQLGDTSKIPAIAGLLDDKDSFARSLAVEALGMFAKEEWPEGDPGVAAARRWWTTHQKEFPGS